MSCGGGSTCLSLPTSSTVVSEGFSIVGILFKGTNQNEFQNFVGATGKASDAIPYTMVQDGSVVSFSGSINGVNINRSYTFFIVVDIPVGHTGLPPIQNQLARVDLVMNEEISGTILFSCRSSQEGIPLQARASHKNAGDAPYLPINAYATWTTITQSAPILQNQALSLFLMDKIGNEEAAFQVFIRTKNM